MVRQVLRDTFAATREFSHNARYFLLSTFLTWTGFQANFVVFNLFLAEGGYAEEFAGHCASLTALGMGLAALPSGFLSDRIGRKPTMVIGGAALGISLFFRCLTLDSGPLLLFSFLAGAGHALVMISSSPFMSENSEPRVRTHLFSAQFVAILIAGVVGNLGGGRLPEILLSVIPQWSNGLLPAYRWTLITAAVISFAAIWPLLFVREQSPVHEERRLGPDWRIHLPTMGKLGFNYIFIGCGAGLIMPFFNLYFANRFDCSSSQIGLYFALSQIVTVFAAITGPRVARRFGMLNTIVLFQLASLPFLVTLGFERHLWIAVLAFLARASLMQLTAPLENAFAMEVVPPSLRAITSGLNMTMWFLGWSLSARVAGWIMENVGYEYPYYMTAALYGFAAVSLYLFFRRQPRGKLVQPTANPLPD